MPIAGGPKRFRNMAVDYNEDGTVRGLQFFYTKPILENGVEIISREKVMELWGDLTATEKTNLRNIVQKLLARADVLDPD